VRPGYMANIGAWWARVADGESPTHKTRKSRPGSGTAGEASSIPSMFHVQRSIRPRSPRRGLPMESQPSWWIHTPGCTCNGVAGMNEGARWRFLGSFSTDDSSARFHVKRTHSYLAGATATRAPSWGRPRSFAIAGPTGGRRTQCRPDIHNWGGRSHTIQPALNHQADDTASEGAVEHGGVLSLRPARPGHAPTARRYLSFAFRRVSARRCAPVPPSKSKVGPHYRASA
jgi:hypothetical protein